jgi:hypothetical protein
VYRKASTILVLIKGTFELCHSVKGIFIEETGGCQGRLCEHKWHFIHTQNKASLISTEKVKRKVKVKTGALEGTCSPSYSRS